MAPLALVSSTDRPRQSQDLCHDLEQGVDVSALVAPYRPYSLTWLNRLRRGEIDMTRPPRLSVCRPVAEAPVH